MKRMSWRTESTLDIRFRYVTYLFHPVRLLTDMIYSMCRCPDTYTEYCYLLPGISKDHRPQS